MMTTTCAAVRGTAVRVGILLVVFGSVAAGCKSEGQDGTQEASVTAEASREQYRAELQEIQQLLRPAQFQLKDGSGAPEVPLTCERPNGDEGRSYLFETQESVGHVDDPEAKASMIADHWRDRGYEVEIATELGFRVVARPEQGGYLRFVVGEPGMTFSAETPCADT